MRKTLIPSEIFIYLVSFPAIVRDWGKRVAFEERKRL